MTHEAMKIEIEIPADMVFGTKVNGEWMQVDLPKLHNTWLAELLRYGVQRKVNDHVAGQGAEKQELARAFIRDLHTGDEKPARVSGGGSSVAPEVTMARQTARKMLHMVFKKLTGESKLGDIVAYGEKHPDVGGKIGKYLTVAESGLPVWNTSAVDSWIKDCPGGRDLIGEARASLNAVDDIEL